jgi:FtsH-binding integral membrane protein
MVKSRLSKTMGYFGYGIGASSAICYALRNSARAANLHWAVCLAGVIGTMIGTIACDYDTQFPLKAAFYTGFTGIMGLSILPLIQMSTAYAIGQASVATGVTMASLASVAFMAPSEQFMNWGGALGIGCGALMGVSLASIFFPGSKTLFNIWLWGGLALFGGITLYDV